MFSKYQFVRMYGPDMTFVLGVDNFYAIVVPKDLSGDAATPEEVASVVARIVKMGAPYIMFEVDCEITTSSSGFAVALAEFDKDDDYTGIDAGNILYLQFIINLTNEDQIIYPEPPQRLVVTKPSWVQVGEPSQELDLSLLLSGAGGTASVLSLRADENPQMRGHIVLASGDNISLVQDNENKKITINAILPPHTHSFSDIQQSGAQVGQVPKWSGIAWVPNNVDWMEIVSKPTQYPPEPHAETHYVGGTDPLTGELDATARVKVSKNEVFVGRRRELNFIEGGNISLQITDNEASERVNIIINSVDTYILNAYDWRRLGEVSVGIFPHNTNENVSYEAFYNNTNVTALLTDNNDATHVRVYQDLMGNTSFISCRISPRAVYLVRFKVTNVNTAGEIFVELLDYAGRPVTALGTTIVNVNSVGWKEVVVKSEGNVSTINIKPASSSWGWGEHGYDYGYGYGDFYADVNISEVRIVGGLAIPAVFTGVRWSSGRGYTEGHICASIFLRKDNTYKFAAWFGCSDDASTAKVEGRLYDENGLVTIFRPLSGLGTGMSDQLITIFGDLITPTVSKFYEVEWRLISDGRTTLYGGDPHMLCMIIYSV